MPGFRIVDVAMLVSGKGGPGIVVSRTGHGWSGPLSVGLGGAGVGAQIGAKVKELVMVLNTDKAVQAFSDGNVKIGADLSAHAGPAGASAEAEMPLTSADAYSYSDANGVFTGVSIEASVIAPRDEVNDKVPSPAPAQPLMSVLQKVGSGGATASNTE